MRESPTLHLSRKESFSLNNTGVAHCKDRLEPHFDLPCFSKTFDLCRSTVTLTRVNKLAPVDVAPLKYAHRFVLLLLFSDFVDFVFAFAALRLRVEAL